MNVVAAIIERDELVLICQRKSGQRHAGKWEFPGGKVELDEDFETALARELREELAIEATVGDEIARYHHTYQGRTSIQLVFYRVVEFEGEPVNRIFEQIRWESLANLPTYDFLEGDIEFVKKLNALAAGGNPRSVRD